MSRQKFLEQMQSAEHCSGRKFVLLIAHRKSLARQLTNYYCCYFCNQQPVALEPETAVKTFSGQEDIPL